MIDISEAVIEIDAGEVDESTAKEVYRNIQTLLGTVAGEQALDRDFGIDSSVFDYPQDDAMAMLAAEYVSKIERYEPRATVVTVDYLEGKAERGNMIPKVVIEIE